MAVGSVDDPRLVVWNRQMLEAQRAAGTERRLHLIERTIGVAAINATENANDYTDQQVAAEQAARIGDVNAEESLRIGGDSSLQGQITSLVSSKADVSSLVNYLVANISGIGNGLQLSVGGGSFNVPTDTTTGVAVGSPFGTTAVALGSVGTDQPLGNVVQSQYAVGGSLILRIFNNSGGTVVGWWNALFIGR